MNYYINVLKKYAVFKGRADRKEYWYFILFNIIATVLFSIIGIIILKINGNKTISNIPRQIYSLAVLLPSIGVAIRRFHDIGKSGWMFLLFTIVFLLPVITFFIPNFGFIFLISFAAFIWYIILMCKEGNIDENKYGPSPKTSQKYTTPIASQFVDYSNTNSSNLPKT